MGSALTETYAVWLSRQMADGGWTTRSLARAWRPDSFEAARKSVRRYLNGQVPIQRTRDELARVMGLPESGPREPSDKEDDLLAGNAVCPA